MLTETGEPLGPLGFTDGVAGTGRTAAEDKTSLHCDWAANACVTTKLSRRTKVPHIGPKGREGGRGGSETVRTVREEGVKRSKCGVVHYRHQPPSGRLGCSRKSVRLGDMQRFYTCWRGGRIAVAGLCVKKRMITSPMKHKVSFRPIDSLDE